MVAVSVWVVHVGQVWCVQCRRSSRDECVECVSVWLWAR